MWYVAAAVVVAVAVAVVVVAFMVIAGMSCWLYEHAVFVFWDSSF